MGRPDPRVPIDPAIIHTTMTIGTIDKGRRHHALMLGLGLVSAALGICDLRADGLLAAWEFNAGDVSGSEVSPAGSPAPLGVQIGTQGSGSIG